MLFLKASKTMLKAMKKTLMRGVYSNCGELGYRIFDNLNEDFIKSVIGRQVGFM